LDLKEKYANKHSIVSPNSLQLNQRLYNTYARIKSKLFNKNLDGINVDLGSGDQGFTEYCKSIGVISYPYDYPSFDIEKDKLPHEDSSVDFITLNAVIEHIKEPDNIFNEINRVLKNGGLVFIRTPNWQIDFKNFYNDPTHIKPYSPITLENLFRLYNLKCCFIEPGLIEKSWFWWKLPSIIKWEIASLIKGGTKSIIAVGYKIN